MEKHQLIGHWSPFIFLRKSTILYLGLKSYPPSQMRSPPTEKPDFSCCPLQPQLSLLLLHPLLQHTQVFSYIYHHHSKKIKYLLCHYCLLVIIIIKAMHNGSPIFREASLKSEILFFVSFSSFHTYVES